jgi:hypothetical protein
MNKTKTFDLLTYFATRNDGQTQVKTRLQNHQTIT